MTTFDDDPLANPGQQRPSGEHVSTPESPEAAPLGGDPITHAARFSAYQDGSAARPYGTQSQALEFLRTPWSWGHFVVFVFFSCASFIVVQTILAIYYAPPQHLSKEQYEHYLMGKPQFVLGSTVICSALIFLFLYVTLSVVRNQPFWATLGWRPLPQNLAGRKPSPWIYFFSGFALAIFVAMAGSQVQTKEGVPLQELFKSRDSALIFMAMAVLVAPLVEETVFRGYLFPLFARSFGIVPGILLTGLLFGLMHGYQLGWTWGIVALLILVGVIFTFARAYTGTVLASFLMHLGYNSMIAASAIVTTHGFTRVPTH
jgi:membrane protease YdiL (CAAX protease family)